MDCPGGGGDHRHLRPNAWLPGGDALHGFPVVGPPQGSSRGSPAVLVPVVDPVLLGEQSTEKVAHLGYGDCFHDPDVLPHNRPAVRAAKVSLPTCLQGYSVEQPNNGMQATAYSRA